MIFGCYRVNLVTLFCFLVGTMVVSLGLFFLYAEQSGNITDRIHGFSENPVNQDCIFTVQTWTKSICRRTFDNFKWFPKYPSFPDRTSCEKNLSSVTKNGMKNATIKRVLVSFSSLEPGFYQFRVKTNIPLRLYVSNSRFSGSLVLDSSKKIKKGNSVDSRGNTDFFFSSSHLMNKNSSLEIVLYCPPGNTILGLDWIVPGTARFVSISLRDFTRTYHLTKSLPPVLPPDRSLLVGFITHGHVIKGFNLCSSRDVDRWRESQTRDISVYTASSKLDTYIHEVLRLIKASLQKAAPGKYPSFKIIKMELTRKSLETKPDRILADLNLTVDGLDYNERFSEYLYVYHRGNQLEFCRPLRYQWQRTVTLYFVFITECSASESAWGIYFIQNIIELQQKALEVNAKVTITACNKQQLRSYTSRLRQSNIEWNEVLLTNVRSRALKAVLSMVRKDSIVVLCESRVKIPAKITEEVRKHTFKALMAYSPKLFQLDCGYFPENKEVMGKWCLECGGVTAMYKEDWEKVLFSENEDLMQEKTKLLDGIENIGIEVVQTKLEGLYRL